MRLGAWAAVAVYGAALAPSCAPAPSARATSAIAGSPRVTPDGVPRPARPSATAVASAAPTATARPSVAPAVQAVAPRVTPLGTGELDLVLASGLAEAHLPEDDSHPVLEPLAYSEGAAAEGAVPAPQPLAVAVAPPTAGEEEDDDSEGDTDGAPAMAHEGEGLPPPEDPTYLPELTEMPEGQCRGALDELGVHYGPARSTRARGINDPIVLQPEINGVRLFFRRFDTRPAPILMDCRLALALYQMAGQLREVWNVESLVHHGVYSYRCIVNTDPCRLSQHAMGLAIDLGAFRDRGGRTYAVSHDFVANGRPTCPPRAQDAPDQFLKDFACWMRDSRTFSVVLTPNYNHQHRSHFHVDLTGLGDDDGDGIIGLRLARTEVDPVWYPGLRRRSSYFANVEPTGPAGRDSDTHVLDEAANGVAPAPTRAARAPDAPVALRGQYCAPLCAPGSGCGLAGSEEFAPGGPAVCVAR